MITPYISATKHDYNLYLGNEKHFDNLHLATKHLLVPIDLGNAFVSGDSPLCPAINSQCARITSNAHAFVGAACPSFGASARGLNMCS